MNGMLGVWMGILVPSFHSYVIRELCSILHRSLHQRAIRKCVLYMRVPQLEALKYGSPVH